MMSSFNELSSKRTIQRIKIKKNTKYIDNETSLSPFIGIYDNHKHITLSKCDDMIVDCYKVDNKYIFKTTNNDLWHNTIFIYVELYLKTYKCFAINEVVLYHRGSAHITISSLIPYGKCKYIGILYNDIDRCCDIYILNNSSTTNGWDQKYLKIVTKVSHELFKTRFPAEFPESNLNLIYIEGQFVHINVVGCGKFIYNKSNNQIKHIPLCKQIKRIPNYLDIWIKCHK